MLGIHFADFMGMGTGGMIGCGLAVAGAVTGILKATYWKKQIEFGSLSVGWIRRKQISTIIILWSLIGTILAIHFTGFMGTGLMATGGMIGCGLAVAGVVAGILKATYWK